MKDCGIACGSCPLLGMCDADDRPAGVLPGVGPNATQRPEWDACRRPAADTDAPDIDPNEPRPADAPSCCGGACNA